MRRKPHDRRHKILLEAFHGLWAEVHPEAAVTRSGQSVDLVVKPRSASRGSHDFGLPLIHRMSAPEPCLFEVFYNTPGVGDIRECLRKQLGYHHQLQVRARRAGRPRPPIPPLWILSSGCPETVLREYRATAMEGWPAGFWQTRPIDAMYLVVINKLPSTRDTLILRLLGRGPTLRQALDQLCELPHDSVEYQIAMPILLEFPGLIPDDEHREVMMLNSWEEIRAKHERLEEYLLAQGKREGEREGRRLGMRDFLLRQLEKRFAALPARYVRRVKRADSAQLEIWGERILDATTLEEIFA